jgi:hypothetical protein
MKDSTFLAKFIKYLFLFLIITIMFAIVKVQPHFIETCDTWDSSKWVYEGNRPSVVNGTWIFQFPIGIEKIIQARSIAMFGYGDYKITFRTSGPRVPGVNYYAFLYKDQTASGGPYNELDIPELFGSGGTYQMSISSYHNTKTANGYKYWTSAINFEDGATHTWSFTYTAKKIDFYIDGQLSFSWTDSTTSPVFAVPPMILYIGAWGNGANISAWTWYVSLIEYQPLS